MNNLVLDRLLPVGQLIHLERLKRGLSRKHLSETVRISQLTMQRLELGQQGVTLETLARITGVLGVDLDGIIVQAQKMIDPDEPMPEGIDADDPDPSFARGCLVPRKATWHDPYNAFCAECPHAHLLPADCPGVCDLVNGQFSDCPPQTRERCPCAGGVASYRMVRERKVAFLAYRERQAKEKTDYDRHDRRVLEQRGRGEAPAGKLTGGVE